MQAVADAGSNNVLDARGLLTYEKEAEPEREEEPVYCSGVDAHDQCPEDYECKALEEKVCQKKLVCIPNDYDAKICKHEEVCYEYQCAEKPRYCDPDAEYDECAEEYGPEYECSELEEKVCSYKDVCALAKTNECKEYVYGHKCHYVKGPCKAYNQEEVCGSEEVCVEYKQEEKCNEEKMCKEYYQRKVCKPNHTCAEYDAYDKCVKYGEDCEDAQGPCKEYAYKKANCEYVDTEECAKHETKQTDCKYVKSDCKEYKQVKKCAKVKGACKAYKHVVKCKQVEDVCETGVCEIKEAERTYEPKVYKSKPTAKQGVKVTYG
eukprot:evm.model.scf_1048.3 EVM.evm.TU.scf_1048.3   scf_1048:20344-21719(-)